MNRVLITVFVVLQIVSFAEAQEKYELLNWFPEADYYFVSYDNYEELKETKAGEKLFAILASGAWETKSSPAFYTKYLGRMTQKASAFVLTDKKSKGNPKFLKKMYSRSGRPVKMLAFEFEEGYSLKEEVVSKGVLSATGESHRNLKIYIATNDNKKYVFPQESLLLGADDIDVLKAVLDTGIDQTSSLKNSQQFKFIQDFDEYLGYHWAIKFTLVRQLYRLDLMKQRGKADSEQLGKLESEARDGITHITMSSRVSDKIENITIFKIGANAEDMLGSFKNINYHPKNKYDEKTINLKEKKQVVTCKDDLIIISMITDDELMAAYTERAEFYRKTFQEKKEKEKLKEAGNQKLDKNLPKDK